MSPWLFKNFFDRVVRQVNERTMRRGVNLRDENGKLSKDYMQMTQFW